MYDSIEEINQKLGNCVVIYRNRPFYVVAGKSKSSLMGAFCDGTREEQIVKLSDPDLNFTSIGEKLGYLNLETYNRYVYKQGTYMMKMPVRRVQSCQGLSQSNVYISGLIPNRRTEAVGTGGSISFNPSIFHGAANSLRDMLNGEYPSLSQVKREFADDRDILSRAFNRNWLVKRDDVGPFSLYYKLNKVGYSEDLNRFVIADRYKLLRKDFERAKSA